MTLITLKFTAPELRILTALAADQLFRREFIDSRLPGFRASAPDLNIGKQLVQRMRLAAGERMARPETVGLPGARATGRQTP